MMFERGYNVANNGFGHGAMQGGGGMIIPIILIVAVIIAVIVAVIFVLRRKSKVDASNEAIEILKIRFVKDEISEEEYLNKKKILG